MSTAGATGVPHPSAVSMGALLAAGAAASAVSTPPARELAARPDPDPEADSRAEGAGDGVGGSGQAAPESEAA